MVKAIHMVDNSGITSRSIISCLGPEIFVHLKVRVPVIMTHRVETSQKVKVSEEL